MPYRRAKLWGPIKPPVGAVLDGGDPINKGLGGRWLCNENGGMRAKNLALNNDVALTNFAVPPTATSGWVPGKFGPALAFDGVDDKGDANIPAFNLSTASYGFGCWINFVSVLLGQMFLALHTTTVSPNSIILWIVGTGQFQLRRAGGAVLATGTTVPVAGRWYHVFGGLAPSGSTIYVNNITEGSSASTGASETTDKISIGYADCTKSGEGVKFSNVLIDSPIVYTRALIPSEIRRLYTEPFAGIVAPRRRVISQGAAAAAGGLLLRRRRAAAC